MRGDEFRHWMGEETGKEILVAVANSDCSKEQMRAAITTYCILYGIEVDTFKWDELMRWLYDCYNTWFRTFEKMNAYMCELLV